MSVMYTCKQCGAIFSRSVDRDRHMNAEHSDTPLAAEVATVLHTLQADGTVDRGQIVELIRQLEKSLRESQEALKKMQALIDALPQEVLDDVGLWGMWEQASLAVAALSDQTTEEGEKPQWCGLCGVSIAHPSGQINDELLIAAEWMVIELRREWIQGEWDELDRLDAAVKKANQHPPALPSQQATSGQQGEELKLYRLGLIAVGQLIDESRGVDGLHLNGDIATWEELRTGGRFEEWLLVFDAALARAQTSPPESPAPERT